MTGDGDPSGARAASGGSARGLVVALDGPASSGKSSVGAAAAAELGYRFCDTGLLYRAVTWLALQRGVSAEDATGLVTLVYAIELLDVGDGRLAHVAIDGLDRTTDVRGPEVDVAVSAVSRVPELRAALLARQRRLAEGGRIIMAGRDIGTVVLPDADLKIFLQATVEERARRRSLERGIDPNGPEGVELLAELRRRDELDSTRSVAPLRAAEDAVILQTDGNQLPDTVRLVVATIQAAERERGAEAPAAPAGSAAVANVETTAAPAPRPPRSRKAPPRPTPVATRMTWYLRVGGWVVRAVIRAYVRLRIEGDVPAASREGPLIVAANHASSADPLIIGAFLNHALDRPLNWLGKREAVELWLIGWAIRLAGIHPIDRAAADLDSVRTAMRILDAGQVLAIFPEGTRSRDGALQRAVEGVGLLALRSGAPVLPVAIIDSDRMWPRGSLLPRWGRRVTVRYGTPFRVADALGAGDNPRRLHGRRATEAATRQVMVRIAELLPSRQRGVYAGDAVRAPESAGPDA